MDFDIAEKNTLSYVTGFLIKKLKSITTCKECAASLTTDLVEPHHTFTTFKEYTDDKYTLTYVSENILQTLGRIHRIIYFILPKFGYICHLSTKNNLLLKVHVHLDWFTCVEHLESVRNDFFYCY